MFEVKDKQTNVTVFSLSSLLLQIHINSNILGISFLMFPVFWSERDLGFYGLPTNERRNDTFNRADRKVLLKISTFRLFAIANG